MYPVELFIKNISKFPEKKKALTNFKRQNNKYII